MAAGQYPRCSSACGREANNCGRAAQVNASRSSFFRSLFFGCLRRRRFTIGWWVVPAQDIVCSQWLVETLQSKLTKRFHPHRLVNRGQHARRDHNLASPRLIAKPRRKIYDATDRCVLPTLLEANLSDSRKAG